MLPIFGSVFGFFGIFCGGRGCDRDSEKKGGILESVRSHQGKIKP